MSASSAPSSTIRFTSRLWHTSRTCSQNVRQRMFGSMPRTSIRSNSAPSGRHTDSRVVGQVIRRLTPVLPEDVVIVFQDYANALLQWRTVASNVCTGTQFQ